MDMMEWATYLDCISCYFRERSWDPGNVEMSHKSKQGKYDECVDLYEACDII
jgi:hypothetical protein